MQLRQRLLGSYALLFTLAVISSSLLRSAIGKFDNANIMAGIALLLGGWAVLLIGVWSALRLAKTISLPFERAGSAARSVAAGRFDVRLSRSWFAEANALAVGFNDMAAALEAYNSTNIARLLAEQRRNEAILQSIDDGMVIFDEKARIERINVIAERQLSVTGENCAGKTLDEILSTEGFESRIRAAIARQQPSPEPESDLVLDRDGQQRELSYTLVPLSDHNRPGLLMVLRDVTDERRFNRLRTEFLLRASHELRTPVTGMRMAMELLAERIVMPKGSREADLIDSVRTESIRMATLVEDLLDFSKLDQASAQLRIEELSIEQLLQEAQSRFTPLAADQDIVLVIDCVAALPALQGDAAAFSRVLDNLIGNAIRYTPKAGQITLQADRYSGGIEIAVADTGPGVTAAQATRIFEPFVQFGHRPGGAGLGLTLCREIVERHGGTIGVQPNPGGGSRFVVRMPWAA